MKRRNVRFAGIASTVILGLFIAGLARATAGSGASASILGTGVAEEKVKTRGNQPYDVVVQSITITPGGHTGWHTHPGIAVAVVTSGVLTVYDADDRSCSPQHYGDGQAYVDPGYGHLHIARNEGNIPTEVLVTYLDVPIGGGVRIDVPESDLPGNCPF
jgi:quercetin dioxygenase-like cupin family protein